MAIVARFIYSCQPLVAIFMLSCSPEIQYQLTWARLKIQVVCLVLEIICWSGLTLDSDCEIQWALKSSDFWFNSNLIFVALYEWTFCRCTVLHVMALTNASKLLFSSYWCISGVRLMFILGKWDGLKNRAVVVVLYIPDLFFILFHVNQVCQWGCRGRWLGNDWKRKWYASWYLRWKDVHVWVIRKYYWHLPSWCSYFQAICLYCTPMGDKVCIVTRTAHAAFSAIDFIL